MATAAQRTEARRMARAGERRVVIARSLGVHVNTVDAWTADIPRANPTGPDRCIDYAHASRLFSVMGVRKGVIAERLGCAESTVRRAVETIAREGVRA